MAYATTTLRKATEDLAARLGDPGFVRWSQVELQGDLIEALRTFNALTGHFRDSGTFSTVAAEPFYDLSTVLPERVGYTVTDQELVASLQYSLLEPASPTLWTGTDQFTLADLTNAVQRRRDQFLLETGMVLSRSRRTIAPPPDGRIQLDEAVITVRRAAWTNSDGVTTRLHREDVWAFNHFVSGWVQDPTRPPEAPIAYAVGETPPLTLQAVPPPQDTGVLDLVAVTRGTLLDPSVGILVGIPDDWTWVVRWGALADLLSKDGLANDAARATYCEQRWQAGIDFAKTASTVWAGRINNVVVPMLSLTEADDFAGDWQNGYGVPSTVLLAGGNLVALTPVPDRPGVDTDYQVTLDLVRNAPIPPSLDDYLQVGPELLDTLYDYAQHLAVVKEGMEAIQSTEPLLERFYRMAGVALSIDLASTPNKPLLTNQTQRDEQHTARMEAVSNG